ncbi:GTPase SAR1 [Bordetella sp. N]|nr:GTPase SAR1 [Bordetella sp. N]
MHIALVGHTNTGKTSLLRTLTRDAGFGDVADAPGTTRRVQGAQLRLDGRPVLAWYDTPGMEDSVALLDYVERLAGTERLDGPARIRRFLDAPEAQGRFEQEARVLTKMLDCDAALYVIDARDPVLAKHQDELALLAACGKPLLPVLNFVRAPAHRTQQWRESMARLGLHALVEFDTVAPPLDGERQLYGRLAMLLDAHAATLQALADHLMQQRQERRVAAGRLAAGMLLDIAALRLSSAADDDALRAAGQDLQARARQREQACIDALLALYNFRNEDYAAEPLPLAGARWDMDLFHPQALKDAGISLGVGVAAGAMAGAAVDVMLAGVSLGTAALIGAAGGGLWQSVERYGQRVLGKLRGYRELSVDDAVLRLLGLRASQLIEALDRRGHAARDPLRLAGGAAEADPRSAGDDMPDTVQARADTGDRAWRKGALPAELKEARSRPEWSALNGKHEDSPRRAAAVRSLGARVAGTAAA